MKDSRLQVRSLVVALILLALTSMSVRAQEASGNFLSNLHDFRINNYMAMDAYYRFSASADNETLNEIVAGINAANDAMNSVIESTSGILSKEQIESLNQEFDSFKDLMRSNVNDVRKTGYPDLRLVSDMANQALTMNEIATELYAIAQESTQTETNPRVEAARSASVMMAQMMAKYSARSNSSVYQLFQGAETEKPLDEQAREFDQLLSAVSRGNTEGDVKSTIETVSSKWEFIRGSYINFNERNVSFIIDRYSKGIIEGLTTTIDLLQKNA
ncbi:hypothetical protein LPB19_12810 [Marinobacter salinisoli]|uniref:Uncharacterized protein n=1 Tax=Marinobacter salinisoli TaxID=2769486 RepID=A0ABX7MPI8_9GAMM|nr:hypothetical protein [Marinobacter salinisoli]QSP94069.1 hypothetical protein LPB19_12810 [Marinobacter salinisoli]